MNKSGSKPYLSWILFTIQQNVVGRAPESHLNTHALDFYSGVYKYIKTIIWLDEWQSLYFRCVNLNYFRHISELWNGSSVLGWFSFFPPLKIVSLQDLSLYYFHASEQICLNIYLWSRCHQMTVRDRDSWHCPAVRLIILGLQRRMLLYCRCFVFWNDSVWWASSLKDASVV